MRTGQTHSGCVSGTRNRLKIISWNLLRLTGATVEDVAALIEKHRPDLLLMQEATAEVAALPALAGGYVRRQPLHGRVYGLAAWSPHPLPPSHALPLPVSTMPGRVPPRLAQIVRVGGTNFANVHLSHGQILNRRQLSCVARSLDGPTAIVGDYNAVGPIMLAEFSDVGPRQPTHLANNIISFRLDRCMVRGVRCSLAQVLERGPSDHHPIMLMLSREAKGEGLLEQESPLAAAHGRIRRLALVQPNWLRSAGRSSGRVRIPKTLRQARKLMRARHIEEADPLSARGNHPLQ